MLIGQNNTNNTTNTKYNENFVIQLITQERYAEAYDMLSCAPIVQTNSVALFNLTLCYLSAHLYTDALSTIEKGISLLNTPLGMPRGKSKLHESILSEQNKGNSYLNPLSEEYQKTFPAMSKDAFIRLKIDCLVALEQWDKVLSTSATLKDKNYNNVNEAISIAQQKLQ